jgi:hypothetical protein
MPILVTSNLIPMDEFSDFKAKLGTKTSGFESRTEIHRMEIRDSHSWQVGKTPREAASKRQQN